MAECRIVCFGPECTLKVFTFQTIVIGSGAAGLNCAEHLYELGVTDIAVVTDRLGAGTSANSGSDKQTYYKLGMAGDVPDSPMDLARALTAGGMCHGDLAYVEALGSAPEFHHLVRNGVQFPHNRYGAHVGYKTDHDPRHRATSAGPKTSMQMVEKSLHQVRRNNTPVFDGFQVVRLLTEDLTPRPPTPPAPLPRREGGAAAPARRVVGALAMEKARVGNEKLGLAVFNARNVVLATGGPGELYEASVYPPGQVGGLGLALEIGCVASNLTESQFGLASTGFRWNLSGTYQQVIPCYLSMEGDSAEPRYFLNEYFPTMRQQATAIFLKGYQWPFHADRLQDYGSSVIDIAVHNEIAAGRRVYLDFTRDPVADGGLESFALENLQPEAREYLQRCGATQDTPFERLQHVNPAAIELYAEHGVDLREPLQIAVCAQHSNGGLRGSVWYETSVERLFAIGEVNGSHGVRPGGCALNAGQVGGLRAAQYIAHVYNETPRDPEDIGALAGGQICEMMGKLARWAATSAPGRRAEATSPPGPLSGDLRSQRGEGETTTTDDDGLDVMPIRREIQRRMTRCAAFIRSRECVAEALAEARAQWAALQTQGMRVSAREQLPSALEDEQLCMTQIAFLEALHAYLERGGGSRGSALVLAPEDAPVEQTRYMDTKRGRESAHLAGNMELRGEILEIARGDDGQFAVWPVPVRPLPEDDSWFENTWREWASGGVFAADEGPLSDRQ